MYFVNEVPNITVKYKKDGVKNYKKIVFDGLTDYQASFNRKDSSITFSCKVVPEEFNDFRMNIANDSIHDFIISATGIRRLENYDTEEYVELKDMKFNTCGLRYNILSSSSIEAAFILHFYNCEDNE